MFYVRKFKKTNRSVEANISYQIVENVRHKDLQAEDTYSQNYGKYAANSYQTRYISFTAEMFEYFIAFQIHLTKSE